MSDVAGKRVARYILDSSDDDLQRLVSISELSAGMARAAFGEVGDLTGRSVIDCGCGPIGGLAVLAEAVGPTGRVVGVDSSVPAVARARTVTSALGLDNVEVIAGDVHDLDLATLRGPFDLAYTRLFLTHQADPVATLRHIARLVRPGGWIVAQEPLRSPPPRSHPQLDALTGYWALLGELTEWAGGRVEAVEDLPRSARDAGLDVVSADGVFVTMDADLGFELHAGTLAAARERAAQAGIPVRRIDEAERDIRAAIGAGYAWVSSPFFLDLRLRTPES